MSMLAPSSSAFPGGNSEAEDLRHCRAHLRSSPACRVHREVRGADGLDASVQSTLVAGVADPGQPDIRRIRATIDRVLLSVQLDT